LPIEARLGECLAVLRVRLGQHLVPVGLARLREQDQRRSVGGLRREREVEQDERVLVEVDEDRVPVEDDPENDEACLGGDVSRRPEDPGQTLRDLTEPVVPERGRETTVRKEKAERLLDEAKRL